VKTQSSFVLWICLSAAACIPDAEGDGTSGDGGTSGAIASDASSSVVTGGDARPAADSAAGGAHQPDASNIAPAADDAGETRALDAGAGDAASTPASDAGPAGFWDAAHPTVHRTSDGAVSLVDFDAGPVLNATAQAACLMLVDAICGRIADCDEALVHIQPAQKVTALNSCKHSFLRDHNCNRATAIASGFQQCVASVAAIDCNQVFLADISGTCQDQVTLQP
jgi:hypothetical protein